MSQPLLSCLDTTVRCVGCGQASVGVSPCPTISSLAAGLAVVCSKTPESCTCLKDMLHDLSKYAGQFLL